ncbi:MAG: hypothetical protein CVU05_02810 [Bacteroidetes bacterium HGW-Bacteroidetes-21]|jgi:hypothetical protein|nr:MAG: hypothetical protein CVU05_02810 [Bacteroidetes bacterium HGW-Bacteroidetes-21]
MIKLYPLLIIFSLLVFQSRAVFSQCTPDPNCNDLLNPGEICPELLPDGTVGTPYNQTVTIIPPASADIGGTTINIVKIKITSVQNLPPGLTYAPTPTNGEFAVTNPITRYCVLLSGTPTTAGTYPLKINVTPYISVLGVPVASTTQVDSTSLSITINNNSGVYTVNANKLSAYDPQPNPFQSSTRLGFFATKTAQYELVVFDIVGNKLYTEKKMSNRGENFFDFNGMKLSKGMYFYSISNGTDKITRQLIKQ